jgi:intracellular multiplication protein IcmB
MTDALFMAPLSRPSSPWAHGAVTFRTPDGKIMPYQPYSSNQNAWINLIFAKPGSGKSVLMSMNNLALCLAPGIERLPRIAIIDIGPSSSGLISLLKEALPANRRHLVTHRRLRMIQKHSINPFDTQLGCRWPTTADQAFLVNLITLLATDANQEKPYDGIPGLVAASVEEAYRDKSDKKNPTPYSSGVAPEVDEAIRDSRMKMEINTTWWEVVDGLFQSGHVHQAHIAQRFAVPLLKDIIKAANSEKIRAEYGEMRVQSTHEQLINAFGRLITDALRMVPILANPTSFDLGEARVVALDLDEVAKGTGIIGERVTAIMYMLARQVTARDYYLTEDFVNDMPAPAHVDLFENVPVTGYREFHIDRIREIRQDPKRICYDEFHRTSKARQVREQVELDMREGRKWQVDIMLASQDLGDFDKNMVNFATGVFVMDGGNAQTVRDIADVFGFQSEFEKRALEKSLRGPRPGGGVFLAKFDIKSVWYTMLLSAPLGAMELWAFSTTAEDAYIRNRLYEKVGPSRARQWLAQYYPKGSAKTDVEGRRQRLKDATSMVMEGETENVFDQIIQDVIEFGLRQERDARR